MLGTGSPAALDVPVAPAKLRVALVGCHDGAEFAGLRHDALQGFGVPDASGGVPRGVDPDQPHAGAGGVVEFVQVVRGNRVAPANVAPMS